MKRLLLSGFVLASSGAWAQGVSDLQPPVPEVPAGQAAPYYPGGPIPQPPAAAPRGAVTREGAEGDKKAAPPGRPILDDSFSNELEGDATSGGPVGAPPDIHVVKKGDTLWDISSFYFHDPHYWPRLWAFNPSITNPHWIYPGDQVRLAAAGKSPEIPIAAPPNEPQVKRLHRTDLPEGLYLRQTGFIEPAALRDAGRIIGSKEEKQMLATLDEAYVSFGKEKPLVVGERYTVFKELTDVKHPVTGVNFGHIVQIFGEIEVKSVTDGRVARVQIIDATEGMERGFRVGPLKRQFRLVDPKPDQSDIAGVVMATLHPLDMVAADQMVFLDKGKKDGVELGNRFLVVRRGDGYQPLLQRGKPQDDRRFPRETVGEVLIIDVKDTYATGFVMKSTKECRIGDRVEARKGF